MSYILKGQLFGQVCKECRIPMSGWKVRLYLIDGKDVVQKVAANPKYTFGFGNTGDEDGFLGEGTIGEDGGYECHIKNNNYDGGPVRIDILADLNPDGRPLPNPVQFTVTVIQPEWMERKKDLVAFWSYTIPNRYFCAILAKVDLWVICGIVTVCKTGVPISGVKVFASDVDWLQHDSLGSAITDSTGKFVIFYTSADFKKTPFPSLNWEMVGGPDLFFRIEALSGTPLLVEPSSRGRKPDRENAGPCFCVELCLSEEQGVPPGHTYPLFTDVGHYNVNSEFTADGLSDKTGEGGNYAFTGVLSLRGILPDGDDPIGMKYRFLYAEYSSGGVLGPWKPITADMIPPTHIGHRQYWKHTGTSWEIHTNNYYVNNSGASYNKTVDSDGWIEVPVENELGLPGSTVPGLFKPNSWMLKFNTPKVTYESFDLTAGTPHKAGDPIPSSQKAGINTFAIKFEACPISTGVVSDSNTLNKIVISNTSYKYIRHPGWVGDTYEHRAVVSLDIKEMIAAGNGCEKMSNDLHAFFTAYHPFAADVDVYLEGNPPLPSPYNAPITAGEACSVPGGQHFDISMLDPCAYVIWLRLAMNLTRGWNRIPDYRIWDHIAFCTS